MLEGLFTWQKFGLSSSRATCVHEPCSVPAKPLASFDRTECASLEHNRTIPIFVSAIINELASQCTLNV